MQIQPQTPPIASPNTTPVVKTPSRVMSQGLGAQQLQPDNSVENIISAI